MKPRIINGGRAALEHALLGALFQPDKRDRVEALKMQLARRGRDRIKLVPGRTGLPSSQDQ